MAGSSKTPEASTDVDIIRDSILDDDALSALGSWNDIHDDVNAGNAIAVDASDYGTGFVVLDKNAKRTLVGIPLAIVGWKFSDADYGEMVTLFVITKDGRKLIVNDGSTGIRDQMRRLVKKLPAPVDGKPTYVKVPNGFTASDYTYKETDADGNVTETPATTYYLAF